MKKKVQIGLMCSPSKRVSHSTKKVKEILVSYGGGMGGANTTYYGIPEDESIEFVTIIDHEGEKVKLGKSYIVHIKEKQLLTTTFDNTAHANYHDKTCNSKIVTRVSVHKATDEFEFLDKTIPNERDKIKVVSSFTEES